MRGVFKSSFNYDLDLGDHLALSLPLLGHHPSNFELLEDNRSSLSDLHQSARPLPLVPGVSAPQQQSGAFGVFGAFCLGIGAESAAGRTR